MRGLEGEAEFQAHAAAGLPSLRLAVLAAELHALLVHQRLVVVGALENGIVDSVRRLDCPERAAGIS